MAITNKKFEKKRSLTFLVGRDGLGHPSELRPRCPEGVADAAGQWTPKGRAHGGGTSLHAPLLMGEWGVVEVVGLIEKSSCFKKMRRQ